MKLAARPVIESGTPTSRVVGRVRARARTRARARARARARVVIRHGWRHPPVRGNTEFFQPARDIIGCILGRPESGRCPRPLPLVGLWRLASMAANTAESTPPLPFESDRVRPGGTWGRMSHAFGMGPGCFVAIKWGCDDFLALCRLKKPRNANTDVARVGRRAPSQATRAFPSHANLRVPHQRSNS